MMYYLLYIFHIQNYTLLIEVQLECKIRGYTAYDYINNKEQNFSPLKNQYPRIERLRTIDRHKYTNFFLSNLIKK